MFAIRDDREYVNQEDLTKAARKVGEAKRHESEFLILPSVTTYHPSDPKAYHRKDGVFVVTFLKMYIPLLLPYSRMPLNFARTVFFFPELRYVILQ